MSSAVFGLVGVILGSLSTSISTIYRERLTTHREQLARDEQYQRDRKAVRDAFQRESILALQTAISDLIRAAYQELDRSLAAELRDLAGKSIWADSLAASKRHSRKMEPVYLEFNEVITNVLPSLY